MRPIRRLALDQPYRKFPLLFRDVSIVAGATALSFLPGPPFYNTCPLLRTCALTIFYGGLTVMGSVTSRSLYYAYVSYVSLRVGFIHHGSLVTLSSPLVLRSTKAKL